MIDKEELLGRAEGLWQDILQNLAGVPDRHFNKRKHCDCPLGCIGGNNPNPGGKDRFRWLDKPDGHTICNVCGSRDGFNLYLDYTGHQFADALKDIADYLNFVPVERREQIKRESFIKTTFPEWYKFDMKHYLKLKEKPQERGESPLDKVTYRSIASAFNDGFEALIPLKDSNGHECDFVMLNGDGAWQTTGGNAIVPPGFYSSIGDNREGKRIYVATSPMVAAIASNFMNSVVHCIYDGAHLPSFISHAESKLSSEKEIVLICADRDDIEDADTVKVSQLMYNPRTREVKRKLFAPFEAMDKIKDRDNAAN